jgi:hypothetical protein
MSEAHDDPGTDGETGTDNDTGDGDDIDTGDGDDIDTGDGDDIDTGDGDDIDTGGDDIDAESDIDSSTDTGHRDGNADDGNGVQIDMISGERMDELTSMEKIRLILDGVHEGNIVILEEGLDPDEESKLIEVTMTEINPDEFTGIEIETYPGTEQQQNDGFFDRLFGRESRTKLTVIGPANRLETLHKDETLISTLVTRR